MQTFNIAGTEGRLKEKVLKFIAGRGFPVVHMTKTHFDLAVQDGLELPKQLVVHSPASNKYALFTNNVVIGAKDVNLEGDYIAVSLRP